MGEPTNVFCRFYSFRGGTQSEYIEKILEKVVFCFLRWCSSFSRHLCKEGQYKALSTQNEFLRTCSHYHYVMPASGGQARISSNNSSVSVFNFVQKFLNIKDIQ